MDDPDTDELKALIALSRQRSLSFGFCLGKTDETSVMVMHRDRAPDVMARAARQAGETARVVCGTARTKGRVMTLTCQGRPIPRMARRVKAYLHSIGLKLKVTLAAPMPAEPGAAGRDDPARWAEVRARVRQLAERRAEAEPELAGKLQAALAIADRRARDGDTAEAASILRRIVEFFDLAP